MYTYTSKELIITSLLNEKQDILHLFLAKRLRSNKTWFLLLCLSFSSFPFSCLNRSKVSLEFSNKEIPDWIYYSTIIMHSSQFHETLFKMLGRILIFFLHKIHSFCPCAGGSVLTYTNTGVYVDWAVFSRMIRTSVEEF